LPGQRQRQRASLLALAYGDAYGSLMKDWTARQTAQVLGSEKAEAPTTWPPAARGLPLAERKRLKKIGLHRLDTQLAMAMVNLLAGDEITDEAYCDWLVRGFESRAWRGADQRMMKIAHGYRATGGAVRLQERSSHLGPLCLGIPMALRHENDAEDILRQTMHVADIFYQSPETSVAAACVAFGVHQIMRGKPWHVPDAEVRSVVDEHFIDPNRLDRLFAEHENGLKLSPIEEEVRRVLDVLSRTVNVSESSIAVEIRMDDHSTVPESIIAAVMHAARTGAVPAVQMRLMDEARLERYSRALESGSLPVEDAGEFFKNEYELSRTERVFQDQMAAERRS